MYAHSSTDGTCANYLTNLLLRQALFPDSLSSGTWAHPLRGATASCPDLAPRRGRWHGVPGVYRLDSVVAWLSGSSSRAYPRSTRPGATVPAPLLPGFCTDLGRSAVSVPAGTPAR